MRTLITTLLLLLSVTAAQSDPEAIIDAMIANLRGESVRASVTMTVTRDGSVSESRFELYSQGDDKALIQVTAPPRDAGQAILNEGSNLFIYNPRLRRVLRLPPSGRSDSFLGSDLSYDDLAGDSFRSDYRASILEEDSDRIVLELLPAPNAPTPYGKVIFTVDAVSYAPLETVYFDQREQAVRRIVFSNIIQTNGKFIPTQYEVTDLLREGRSTVMRMENYELNAQIPASCFTQAALERGCP
jgi:outer membrane lipoprotein-sorting protein